MSLARPSVLVPQCSFRLLPGGLQPLQRAEMGQDNRLLPITTRFHRCWKCISWGPGSGVPRGPPLFSLHSSLSPRSCPPAHVPLWLRGHIVLLCSVTKISGFHSLFRLFISSPGRTGTHSWWHPCCTVDAVA